MILTSKGEKPSSQGETRVETVREVN